MFESDFGDVRSRLPASLVTTVEGAEGVAAAEGSVQGYAQLVKADGKALELRASAEHRWQLGRRCPSSTRGPSSKGNLRRGPTRS